MSEQTDTSKHEKKRIACGRSSWIVGLLLSVVAIVVFSLCCAWDRYKDAQINDFSLNLKSSTVERIEKLVGEELDKFERLINEKLDRLNTHTGIFIAIVFGIVGLVSIVLTMATFILSFKASDLNNEIEKIRDKVKQETDDAIAKIKKDTKDEKEKLSSDFNDYVISLIDLPVDHRLEFYGDIKNFLKNKDEEDDSDFVLSFIRLFRWMSGEIRDNDGLSNQGSLFLAIENLLETVPFLNLIKNFNYKNKYDPSEYNIFKNTFLLLFASRFIEKSKLKNEIYQKFYHSYLFKVLLNPNDLQNDLYSINSLLFFLREYILDNARLKRKDIDDVIKLKLGLLKDDKFIKDEFGAKVAFQIKAITSKLEKYFKEPRDLI